MVLPTKRSDLEKVGISALVLSDKSRSTPSDPNLAIFCRLGAGWLPTGVKSNL